MLVSDRFKNLASADTLLSVIFGGLQERREGWFPYDRYDRLKKGSAFIVIMWKPLYALAIVAITWKPAYMETAQRSRKDRSTFFVAIMWKPALIFRKNLEAEANKKGRNVGIKGAENGKFESPCPRRPRLP